MENNNILEGLQNHFGYNDKEMKLFVENPRNQEVLNLGPKLISKTIIAEVVQSHGCNSGHKAGDKFYFDGAGNLITKMNPKRICVFAISQIATLVFGAHELLYAGVDPNNMRFKRVSCPDVGVKCGGWGSVVMELRVEDRK